MNEPNLAVVDAEAALRLHPHAMTVVEREGYCEFRCEPSSWSYASPRPYRELLAEYYSVRTGVDPHGLGTDCNFWSGSDAALRLRAADPADLALREMSLLATRYSVGLNAPRPWVALPEVAALGAAWEPEASDLHWTAHTLEGHDRTPWSHYGMEKVADAPVITGYYMTGPHRVPSAELPKLRSGGPGAYYAWSTVARWDRWPRRQDLPDAGTNDERPGMLRLFVSHRWDSAAHPDPDGAQLLALKVGLTLALACALRLSMSKEGERTTSGLPEVLAAHCDEWEPGWRSDAPLLAWAEAIEEAACTGRDEGALWPALQAMEGPAVAGTLGRLRAGIGLWYDYASMYQEPRSADEQRHFEAEILRLNEIQASACTVVLAGGEDYVRRAWCFLELCGGMRNVVTELTPTWSNSVAAAGSLTRWGSRSDQLIGALNVHGPEAIASSGLRATHPEDLPVIARLLAQLPLTGFVESDDSDLVGGTMPLPFDAGKWTISKAPQSEPLELMVPPLRDPGRVAPGPALREVAQRCDALATLAGGIGVWVYTTQRALSLSWAARADELRAQVRAALRAWTDAPDVAMPPDNAAPPVACCWADARALADDGQGWTRVVPSSLHLLVIVTQPELPAICRLYERTLRTHLAAGVPVLTLAPATGRVQVHRPSAAPAPGSYAHVLSVPRIRRSHACLQYQLLSPGAQPEGVEVLAALRLEPSEGFVHTGDTVRPQITETETGPPTRITTAYLLSHGALRARAEGLARGMTASWDSWAAPRLGTGAWEAGLAPSQLSRFEDLVRRSCPLSDNPLVRRRLLYIVVEDDEGYALSAQSLVDMDVLVKMLLEREASGSMSAP